MYTGRVKKRHIKEVIGLLVGALLIFIFTQPNLRSGGMNLLAFWAIFVGLSIVFVAGQNNSKDS